MPSIIATIGTQFFWRGLSALLASSLARNFVPVRETVFHHILVGISAGLSGFWTRLVHGLIIVVSVSVYARVFKSWR